MGGGGKGKGAEKDTKRTSKGSSKGSSSEVYARDALLQLNPSFRASPSKETSPSSRASKGPWGNSSSLTCRPREELGEILEPARPRAASDSAHPAVRNKPTTVMLKSIPFEYCRTGLCEELAAAGFGYAIDFLYLPIDSATGHNLGHAFVNVRTKDALRDFMQVFDGVPAKSCLPRFVSKNNSVCSVSTAPDQGRDVNMKKLCTVSNLNKWRAHDEWQPLFLDDYGQKIPPSQWQMQADDSPNRPRAASQQSSPMLAPQASPVFKPAKAPLEPKSSPMLRAEAKVFAPASPVLRAEAKVFSPAIRAEANLCSPSMRPDAAEFVPNMEMMPEAAFALDAS